MNLLDIINLTKAGYKKKDIDALIEAEKEQPDPDKKDSDTDTSSKGDEGDPDIDPAADDLDDADYPDDEPDEIDYKDKYLKLEKEMKDVQKQLKIAQKSNVRKNSDQNQKEDTDKIVTDIFREFM